MQKIKITSSKTRFILCLACLALLFLLFAIPILNIGLGEDEGVFAVQAVRLLHGQLPNLDFPIPYLGGNVFYNAFVMHLLGQSFWALRVGLLLIFILNGLAIFYLSSRLMNKGWALLTTATVFSLTVGFYPYLNASWNALLFSFIAFIAFIKALETEKRKFCWLILCGVCVAFSIFMKQTVGLYTAFSLYIIQLLNLMVPNRQEDTSVISPNNTIQLIGKIFIASGTILIAGYLVFLLSPHSSFHNWLFFGLPGFCILGGTWNALLNRQSQIDYEQAVKHLVTLILGMALTFCILLIPYAMRHGLTAYLYDGLIFRPGFYIKMFYQDYTITFKGITFLVLLLFTGGLLLIPKTRTFGFLLALTGITLFAGSSGLHYPTIRKDALSLLYQFPLWLIGIGIVSFLERCSKFAELSKTDRLALAIFIWGVFLYLNTYPVIALPYVVCNLAPFGIVMGYLSYRLTQKYAKPDKLFIFLFFAYWITMGSLNVYQYHGQPIQEFLSHPFKQYTISLPAPHGGLLMTKTEWMKRQSLIQFINTHSKSKNDFYILADSSPEIYFLTEHLNPTRYDYYLFSLANGTDDLICSLEAQQVRYIFVEPSRSPLFPVEPKVLAYLAKHYKPSTSLYHWQVFERMGKE